MLTFYLKSWPLGKKEDPNKSKLASFNFNSKLKTLKPEMLQEIKSRKNSENPACSEIT